MRSSPTTTTGCNINETSVCTECDAGRAIFFPGEGERDERPNERMNERTNGLACLHRSASAAAAPPLAPPKRDPNYTGGIVVASVPPLPLSPGAGLWRPRLSLLGE
jgi:hypothetical protein